MGRKRAIEEITEQHLNSIEQMARTGLSIREISLILGICQNTLKKYRDEDPRVDDAYAKGKAVSDGNVGNALYKEATGGNINAIRWYETTRCNRAEKTQVDISEKQYVVAIPPEETMESFQKKFEK